MIDRGMNLSTVRLEEFVFFFVSHWEELYKSLRSTCDSFICVIYIINISLYSLPPLNALKAIWLQ